MENFADRFEAARYAADERVEVATAGSRCQVPEGLFARAQGVAAAYELRVLPAIDIHEYTRLTREQCRSLVGELEFVRSVVSDPLLDEQLATLLVVIQACARSPFDVELSVVGP